MYNISDQLNMNNTQIYTTTTFTATRRCTTITCSSLWSNTSLCKMT